MALADIILAAVPMCELPATRSIGLMSLGKPWRGAGAILGPSRHMSHSCRRYRTRMRGYRIQS